MLLYLLQSNIGIPCFELQQISTSQTVAQYNPVKNGMISTKLSSIVNHTLIYVIAERVLVNFQKI